MASLSDFRARYPAFAAISDGVVDAWLAEGEAETEAWSEATQDRGSMAYAAHRMAEQGLGTGAAAPAGVTSFKSGTFSAQVSETVASRTGYSATAYGREFIELARRNFAGPRLAWTPPAHV